jgi:hypothetical protein
MPNASGWIDQKRRGWKALQRANTNLLSDRLRSLRNAKRTDARLRTEGPSASVKKKPGYANSERG